MPRRDLKPDAKGKRIAGCSRTWDLVTNSVLNRAIIFVLVVYETQPAESALECPSLSRDNYRSFCFNEFINILEESK